MQVNRKQKLVKVYPIFTWGFAVPLIMIFLCMGGMALLRGAIIPALFFLIILGSIPFFMIALSSIFAINNNIIVIMSLFKRQQIGWDEVTSIEVTQKWSITLHGKSSTGVPKTLVIPGPRYWWNNKTEIRKIFGRQIKLRGLKVDEMPVGVMPGSSSKNTQVSVNSEDPELYIAASTKPTNINMETIIHNNTEENIDLSAIAPGEHQSAREIELENKLKKPEVGINILFGSIGAIGASIFSVLVWAFIMYVTHFEFSIVAIGVGFFIGFIARTLAGKGTMLLGLISGGVATISCVSGSLLGAIIIIGEGQMPVIVEILAKVSVAPQLLLQLYLSMLQPVDLLFYFVAIVSAYRVAAK